MNPYQIGPVVVDLKGLVLDEVEKQLLAHPMVGGLILFSRNYRDVEQLVALITEVRLLRPDIVIAVDQEGGRVQRFRQGFTRVPPMQALGRLCQRDASAGLRLTHECGWLMATELLSVGIDISFAPVLDVDEHHSRVIGDRSFAPDPDVVIAAARAFMEGMHEAGMATTGKHFPGHGSVCADSHLELPVDKRSLVEVREHDLRPFSALKGELDAVMPAHILFPNIDEQLVGFSPWWLQRVLRQELNFDGVIFSDDLSMAGAAAGGDFIERAERALKAGCDAVLVCNSPADAEAVVRHLEKVGCPLSSRLAQMRARKAAPSLASLANNERRQIIQKQLAELGE